MRSSTTIDVCIATFRRPLFLTRCLASLRAQDLQGIALRVIVIDNDKQQSAQETVTHFREACGFPVVYQVEPQQNIALARNRALQQVQAEYLAFVDDDELVSSFWLQALLATLLRNDADIVFGPVISKLPPDAPDWAHKIFRRPEYRTDASIDTGGAGNVLMKHDVVRHAAFDPAFGLTGGEDTSFFHRAHLNGRKMVWCQEAIVLEPVVESRLTLEWARRRNFRGGQNYTRIFVKHYSFARKALWFGTKLTQLSGALLLAPLLRMVSYPSYIALTVRIAAAAGQLSYLFSGAYFEEYNACRYQ